MAREEGQSRWSKLSWEFCVFEMECVLLRGMLSGEKGRHIVLTYRVTYSQLGTLSRLSIVYKWLSFFADVRVNLAPSPSLGTGVMEIWDEVSFGPM